MVSNKWAKTLSIVIYVWNATAQIKLNMNACASALITAQLHLCPFLSLSIPLLPLESY